MQLYVLSLVDHTHTTTTQFLDDAVMRDGLADHWRESYVGETGKSMKAVELAPSTDDCCRKIPITLIDPGRATAGSLSVTVISPFGLTIPSILLGRNFRHHL